MNKEHLTLGSLFDGSGGFPLAGLRAGITPIWGSEVEPFPIRVTTKRLSGMKHYGDVSALNGGDLEPVDIITFGSPCQDMSIAGKRTGLDGSRSSLFYEAIRIVKEMREKTNGEKPRYIVWENVPGAFSSNGGEDFRKVLEEVIRVKEPDAEVPAPDKDGWPYADTYLGDGWSVAYRTLDAQHFGVPQRRRRIYLVADFAGESAPKVLFVSDGLSGYFTQSRSPWQSTAGDSEKSTGTAGRPVLNDMGGSCMDVSNDVTGTLRAETHGHPPVVVDDAPKACGFCTEHSAQARGIGFEEECSPTLRAGVVPATVALDNHPMDSRLTIEKDGKVQTLSGRMGTGGNNVPMLMQEEVTPQTLRMRAGGGNGGKGALVFDNKTGTLACNNDQTLFVPEQESCYWDGGQTAGTLTKQNAGGNQRMPDKENFNCVLEAEKPVELETEQTAFGISSYSSHAMLSDNPHAGIYEAKTSRTLDLNGGAPTCQQGGIAIVGKEEPVPFACNQRDEVRTLGDKSAALAAQPGMKQQTFVMEQGGQQEETTAFHVNTRRELVDLHGKSGALMASQSDQMQTFVLQGSMIGRADKNGPQGCGINEDVSFTLTDADRHAVCAPESGDGVYAMTTGSFMETIHEKSPTLMARDYKDPTTVAPVPADPVYTVRRLTPVECARLQALPDWWCDDLGTENPTDEEIAFWKDVFETHRKVITHASKPKTEKQIRKWLTDPYSDNAAYRMYGNGICVNCAIFVLAGIVWAEGLEERADDQ